MRLGIEIAHLTVLAGLPSCHRDPFDQVLIPQAIHEDALFVTEDRHAASCPVRVVRWSER